MSVIIWKVLFAIIASVPQILTCPSIICPGEFLPGKLAPFVCGISSCTDEFNSLTWEQQFEGEWKPVIVCSELSGNSCQEVSTGYEYTIADRATLDYASGSFIFLIEPTILEDSGQWRCKHNENQLSDICDVIIYTELTTSNLTITPNDYEIIIGREYDYQCTTPRASPVFNTIWGLDGRNNTDGQDYSSQNELGIWRLDNRIALTHTNPSPIVTCYMDKAVGDISVSAKTEVSPSKSYYAANIESFDSSLPNGAIELPFETVFSCVSSGEEPSITWYNGSDPLDMDLFDEVLNTIDGSFSYGQTTALQSNLTWRVPSEGYTCADIDKYNGEYVCKSSSPAGSDITEDTSKPRKAVLEYAPILKSNYSDYHAYIYTEVTLECEACASPNEEYAWSSANGRNLTQFFNMTQIILTVYENDFNDTFYCTVTNTEGSGTVVYKIYEIETTIMETTAAVSSVPISTELPVKNSNLDIGAKLGIGLSVGIILCGIIVSSFVFYHRTRGYTKPRTSLQHNPYENEDNITHDDIKDVTPYEQVNGIGYEPDSPTSYVNVNPTSYVNVKSTSYVNIDQTSYVNVNAMEPSKYEQLKQKNSGNIEISTYEDLNAKAK